MKICTFCNAYEQHAEPFCPARMLIPGERFPHEWIDSRPSASDRHAGYLSRRAEQRARGHAGTRKRR